MDPNQEADKELAANSGSRSLVADLLCVSLRSEVSLRLEQQRMFSHLVSRLACPQGNKRFALIWPVDIEQILT